MCVVKYVDQVSGVLRSIAKRRKVGADCAGLVSRPAGFGMEGSG